MKPSSVFLSNHSHPPSTDYSINTFLLAVMSGQQEGKVKSVLSGDTLILTNKAKQERKWTCDGTGQQFKDGQLDWEKATITLKSL
jgi:hypothetical protein